MKITSALRRTARAAGAPLLRLGFAATGAVAPSLTARAAERLFLTPPRRTASRREREVPGGDDFAVAVHGEILRGRRFGTGPAVLLVHGWGGRGSQMAAFVPPLVSAGCTAVFFDAPAHGASTGSLASGVAFAEAVASVSQRVEARAAIGHSMGATALGWAVADGLRLDAAVLLGPPRGAAAVFQRFCDALVPRQRVRDALRLRIERRYGVTPEEFDLATRASAASTPLVVFHDRNDPEVAWEDGHAIARAWPGAELVSTSGLGHRGTLRDPAVVTQAAAFVLEHMARCACGRLGSEPVGGTLWCSECAVARELYDRSSRSGGAST
jgi:hypothetical protein